MNQATGSFAAAEGEHIAAAVNLIKTYTQGQTEIRALDGVSVGFARARFTAVTGPSGSGKSTLMHCMAGLDAADSGHVVLDGTELTGLSDRALTRVRREKVGFLFQSFNLLPQLTALENIALPLTMAGRSLDHDLLDHLVGVLGIGDRMSHRPGELSGGQQQRVALARALAARPAVVFADEPTGSLDSRSGTEVLELLRRSVRDLGQTVVMVTHDPHASAYADRVLVLADGRIVDDVDVSTDSTSSAASAASTGYRADVIRGTRTVRRAG
ncbi:ABC transporter ATP-binding protein [Streptomyces sp. NPDC017991]|uniref:ABC transporter ATP-binding protein n=1 Tax=Streptomyces sp. NPDC017991 TaxID=3365026 RepID=UPI00378E9BE7